MSGLEVWGPVTDLREWDFIDRWGPVFFCQGDSIASIARKISSVRRCIPPKHCYHFLKLS